MMPKKSIIFLLIIGFFCFLLFQFFFKSSPKEALSANGTGILSGTFTVKKADGCTCTSDNECYGGYCCFQSPGASQKFCQSTPCPVFPTAIMACQIVDCKGPGCQCNGSWVTYNGSGVIYKILNQSTPSEGITNSVWLIKRASDSAVVWNLSCSGKCDLTMPIIPSGDYIIDLTVTGIGGYTDTASHPIRVKQEAYADFSCSLDGLNWRYCLDLPLLTIGTTLYLKDDPSLAHHSEPSEGVNRIIHWTWKSNGNILSQDSQTSLSLILESPTTILSLTVADEAGRSDSVSYEIRATFPLLKWPKWKEMLPF